MSHSAANEWPSQKAGEARRRKRRKFINVTCWSTVHPNNLLANQPQVHVAISRQGEGRLGMPIFSVSPPFWHKLIREVIWALHQTGMLDLVLFVISSPDEEQFHLHGLEIVCLLFREQVCLNEFI